MPSPGPRGRSHGAIFAGLVAGVVLLAWLVLRIAGGSEGDDRRAGDATERRSNGRAASRWMPRLFGGGGGDAAAILEDTAPDAPRIEVTVVVVDLAGDPVPDATVEAKADVAEYSVAGMDDDEYQAWLERHPGYDDEQEGGGEGGGEDGEETRIDRPRPLATVVSGRTDRDGRARLRLKRDAVVVFQARDGRGREGASETVYLYDMVEEEEDDWGVTPDRSEAAPDDAASGADQPVEVTIRIAEPAILRGTVVDGLGRPVVGAEVLISSWEVADLETSAVMVGHEDGHALRTDENGRFESYLRASGAFDVEVFAPGYQPAYEQAIQALPGRETVVNLTLLAAITLRGIVLGPDGVPAQGAHVQVQGTSDEGDHVSASTQSGPDGRFVAEGLAPGTFVVSAAKEGFRPVDAFDVTPSSAELVLRLARGGTIRGEVRVDGRLFDEAFALSGEPLEKGALLYGDVYAAWSGAPDPTAALAIASGVPPGRERESPAGVLDARPTYFTQVSVDEQGNGTFEITGLPPGTYRGLVSIGTAIARFESIDLHEGASRTVRLSLPERGSARVEGTIRSSSGASGMSGSIMLSGVDVPTGMSSVPDEDGRFAFLAVPPGTYVLQGSVILRTGDHLPLALAAMIGPETVTVAPGDRTVRVDLVVNPAMTYEPPREIRDEPYAVEDDWDVGDPGEDDLAGPWMPDLWVEEVGDTLVVSSAPAGPPGARLFGGDRITTIDGTAIASVQPWEALDLLHGPKDSTCVITADRPATGESITVHLPRTRKADEWEW